MSNNLELIVTANDETFWATPNQAELLNSLTNANKGGIATIHGYKPSTNYISEHIADLQVVTSFSYTNLCKRKLELLDELSYDDLPSQKTFGYVVTDTGVEVTKPVVFDQAEHDLFEQAKKEIVDSLQKTLDGDRSDARRQAHDRNYIKVNNTIKVNLLTEKTKDGTIPVLVNGHPVVDSILMPVLIINEKVIMQGEKKKVNSSDLTKMKNAIESCLNQRSIGYRVLSLKPDNFDSLKISGILVETVDNVPANVFI